MSFQRRIPPEFLGISDETLRAWRVALQQALQDLAAGAKPSAVNYAQGDGSKGVTYIPPTQALIEQRIRAITAALGEAPPRRAIGVRF